MRNVVTIGVVIRLRDRELDGDVKDPVTAVALKPELAGERLTVNEVVPQALLLRVDTERYPGVNAGILSLLEDS